MLGVEQTGVEPVYSKVRFGLSLLANTNRCPMEPYRELGGERVPEGFHNE